ncbi:MAG: ATP-binding protein, partial [Gammaproteobacteria bacterium]|nr:ATP-binding protein [Gammaproteobacteria bacterium]
HGLQACWSVPIPGVVGRVLGTLAFYFDVPRAALPAELETIERGAQLVSMAIKREQAELELAHARKMESIGQLAAGIAHEINTPMQYVGNNTEFLQGAFGSLTELLQLYGGLLQAAKTGAVPVEMIASLETAVQTADVEFLSEEIPAAIQGSADGVDRVASIVRAMKEFSHPGSKTKVPTDLNRAIEISSVVCSNEWKYVAEIVTTFDPRIPRVPCLPGEINQVILNIIVNAAHAVAEVVGSGKGGKGTITLSTRLDGDWAEIRIGDSGPGIPPAVKARMFDPFFTTKGVGKGTGQGLAIAYAVVVEKHGGTIACETEVGQGTTFIIRLPLQPPAASE